MVIPLLQSIFVATSALLSALQMLGIFGLAYYYLLLAASAFRIGKSAPQAARRSFAIAIPAHNEELVLAKTIESLAAQDYPAELLDIYVVADHCSDHTASVARERDAFCFERHEGLRGRKVYALRWLLEQILAANRGYDAIAVFDADSRVNSQFFTAMNAALGEKDQVLQGRHVIRTANGNDFGGLAAVDMQLNNRLRNQAKRNLGLSARLMGDAMCFPTEVIRRYGWPSDSLGEDREYGLYLLTQGVKVTYVPEAISLGQAAPSWRDASKQRLRWYGGGIEIQKRYALKLLQMGLRRLNPAALDQAIELLLPPFSLLALLSALVVSVQAVWPLVGFLPFAGSALIFCLWGAFPIIGLVLEGAPTSAYCSLLLSPVYLVWRVVLGVRARLKGGRVEWVRTRRQEEQENETEGRSP